MKQCPKCRQEQFEQSAAGRAARAQMAAAAKQSANTSKGEPALKVNSFYSNHALHGFWNYGLLMPMFHLFIHPSNSSLLLCLLLFLLCEIGCIKEQGGFFPFHQLVI